MTIASPSVSLTDKYAASDGRALMSGVQALVRLTLEQRRLDDERGVDTRVYVSGYQGSPLGGVDLEMGRAARFLDEAGVVFQAGLNEELAATAVAGTQILGELPGRRHDGVTGFWYGKNPGLDRAADAIRHGNLAGTAPLGGAVAWIGDDPACKSSTVPSACEQMCQSLHLPLLAPGSVAEVIEYGLHAVALSRASGLWAGLKIVTDVADASATVDLGALRAGIPAPEPAADGSRHTLVGPTSLDAEHDALTRRLDLARAYGRSAGLNRVTFSSRDATLGVLAPGTSYPIVQRALDDLGLDEAALDALGIRLIRLGMPFPLADDDLVAMTAGLGQVLVVEDKLPFVEGRLKEALYGVAEAPVVVGRRDENGRPLLTERATLGAEDVARALASRIGTDRLPRAAATHLQALAPTRPSRVSLPVVAARTPFFCSGCPHNTSTRTAPDTLVGVGIGCHSMIALGGEDRGKQIGLTQMGGEGAQWFGLAPFTDDRHFVQNLGDGTFHHSGSLAVRAAVAAGVTMTFKLLYNDAVAMTGGQRAEGRLDVPALTRWLAVEGVRRVVVTTAEPAGYRGIALDPIASVRHRDDFAEAERELAALDGVTVLIHDDRCAAEERRMRKRGLLPTPAEKVVINERVCEGCGDCGDVSTCLSVQPVETEFGRKTRIHQASCNTDLSCLKGDCPSFLLVEPKAKPERRQRKTRDERKERKAHDERDGVPAPPVELTAPVGRVPTGRESTLLRMPGIGGTGVVTVSQILQMAARLDDLHATGLDQTGLAQKGGPVVSDIRIAKSPVSGSPRASHRTADVLIGFDLLGAAADGNLAAARPDHTVAVVNTAIVPTAAMVTNRVVAPGSPDDALARIETVTRRENNLYLDAQGLSEALFGDHMPANMLLVGAAFQHGCLPLSAEAIEGAIRLNGAATEKNLAAFRWGRAAVLDRDAVRRAVAPPAQDGAAAEARPTVEATPEAAGIISTLSVQPDTVPVSPDTLATPQPTPLPGTLRAVLETRTADLIGYQNERYARSYAESVARVAAVARERSDDDEAGERIAVAYAKALHKLMAYKDEYEVARLHLDGVEQAKLSEEFGDDAAVSVLLHPPVLRALGMKRKIRLRRTAPHAFRALRAMRGLRGTALDPFGYAGVRRTERELIAEYRKLMREALRGLTPENAESVLAIAELPDTIRGYEDIKLARVTAFRQRAAAALTELAGAEERGHRA